MSGDCPHDLGPPTVYTSHGGPMDGDWLVRSCLHCNAFSLGPVGGGDAIGPLLAMLELGCIDDEAAA